jgi:hypothetical protein
MRIRITSLWLAGLFGLLLLVLLLLRTSLLEAHADETIHYVASDAATYYRNYEDLYFYLDLSESPVLFLVGSPILFMKLAGGELLRIQLINLLLMFATLKVAFDCLRSAKARLSFLAGALAFPYFLFGFLSLNKEIYAMSAAVFYASYLLRGRWSHLLIALVLAMCARYYMFVAMLVAFVLVPREGPPRYRLMVALLIVISIAAPVAKTLVPEYSSEDVIGDVPSTSGAFFSTAVDSYGYALVYPLKYIALIPMRAYSAVIDSTRAGNAMEGVVSLASMAALLLALAALRRRQRAVPVVRRLVVLALVAPIPMMWSEIMHWRYYSFVYFFLLFAVILHYVERHREPRRTPAHA